MSVSCETHKIYHGPTGCCPYCKIDQLTAEINTLRAENVQMREALSGFKAQGSLVSTPDDSVSMREVKSKAEQVLNSTPETKKVQAVLDAASGVVGYTPYKLAPHFCEWDVLMDRLKKAVRAWKERE